MSSKKKETEIKKEAVKDASKNVDNIVIYSWRRHLMTEYPLKTIFVFAVFTAFISLSYDLTGSFGLSIVGLLLLTAYLKEFFLPLNYSLTKNHIEIKSLFMKRTEPLSKYRKFWVEKNGIFLSTDPNSKVLDQFRGLLLLCNKEQKIKISEILKDLIGEINNVNS